MPCGCRRVFFVANSEPAILEQPIEDPFDDATMDAQPTAMFGVSLGDERLNAPLPQRHADFLLGVVIAIGKGFVRTLATSSAGVFDRPMISQFRIFRGDGRVSDGRCQVLGQ